MPLLWPEITRTVAQDLELGTLRQTRSSPGDTPFAITGRRLYVIGDVDGGFRPRSNPYDLHTYGAPLPDDPLANALQGIWAQPVRGVAGYAFTAVVDGEPWPLLGAERFTQTIVEARFDFSNGPLRASRSDFVPQDRPALFTSLSIFNTGPLERDIRLRFQVHFDLRDAWFTSLAAERNGGELLEVVPGSRLLAVALGSPLEWAVAVGADRPAEQALLARGEAGGQIGSLEYAVTLAPGAEQSWTFAIVIESEAGTGAALRNLGEWLPLRDALRSEKAIAHSELIEQGPILHCPEPEFDAAFTLALANMHMLEVETPVMGRYFYAGLPAFPFWFSVDGACSLPVAPALIAAVRNHLLLGPRFQQGGRIPHQVSPAGHLVFDGRTPETPLWVMAAFSFFRWTGDREFLAAAYAPAVAGMFDFIASTADPHGVGYPSGDGLLEMLDMAPRQLDSAAYSWAGFLALADMADAMSDPATAGRARSHAQLIERHFDADWWDADGETYAMSLEADGARRLASHWAVITPLEVGLATPERAVAMMATVRARHLNAWGLEHAAGSDDRVWTYANAACSRAAYRYGDPETGFEMLVLNAETLRHGSIGMMHELVPDGLCFLQLWSASTFVRGVLEDLLGLGVRADKSTLAIAPRLPKTWDFAEVERLGLGGHRVTVRVTPTGASVVHLEGPGPLEVLWAAPDGSAVRTVLAPGESAACRAGQTGWWPLA